MEDVGVLKWKFGEMGEWDGGRRPWRAEGRRLRERKSGWNIWVIPSKYLAATNLSEGRDHNFSFLSKFQAQNRRFVNV